MKGLLIKDFILLKNQRLFLGAIVLMSIAFSTIYANPFFAVGYATSLVSVFTVSTIGYDEYENGMTYLFTLPFERKDYVREKYLFGILITAVALAGAWALSFSISVMKGQIYTMEEWMQVAAASLLIALVILSFSIPLQLKFGSEKSRIALLITFGGIVLALLAVVKIAEAMRIDIDAVIDRILSVGFAKVFAGLGIMGILLIGISYLASVKIMNKKEL